jgi:hypothetical protein
VSTPGVRLLEQFSADRTAAICGGANLSWEIVSRAPGGKEED